MDFSKAVTKKVDGKIEKKELQRSVLKKKNMQEEGDIATFLKPHTQKMKIATLLMAGRKLGATISDPTVSGNSVDQEFKRNETADIAYPLNSCKALSMVGESEKMRSQTVRINEGSMFKRGV
jgi:hypothetical protein